MMMLACVASVSMANFEVLAVRKLGREQKKKEREGGEVFLKYEKTAKLFGS